MRGLPKLLAVLLTAAASTAPAAELRDDDLLVLAVRLDSEQLADSLTCYRVGGGHWVPLVELARTLGLALEPKRGRGTVEGWAFAEDRRVLIDVAAREASFDGRTERLTGDETVWAGDELFVDAGLFSRLFPIDLRVDERASALVVSPREKLPLQLQREHEQKLQRALAGRGDGPNYPEVAVPYSLWKTPSVDQTVTSTVTSRPGAEPSAALGYSTLATGELLYLETQLHVQGGVTSMPQARVHMGRKDPEGGLLGPLKATAAGFGDVAWPGMDLVAFGSSGLGVELTNRPLQSPTHFDRHSFRGELPPGWEAELYRNDVLIGYQFARPDGLYEFIDVPLLFGDNAFTVLLRGPQGQLREDRQRFNVAAGAVPPGEVYYRASGVALGANGRRSLLEADLGLSRNVSASLGLATLERAGNERAYARASIDAWYGVVSGGVDLARELGGGTAAKGVARAQLGPVRLSAEHTHSFDYDSELLAGLRQRSSVKLDGQLTAFSRGSLPTSLELRREVRLDRREEMQLRAGLGLRYRMFGVSHELRVPLMGAPLERGGAALVSASLGAVNLRGALDYTWADRLGLRSASINADTRVAGDYSLNGGVSYLNRELCYQAGAGKTEGMFGLSINATWSKSAGPGAMLALNIAFQHDEREGGFHVQARNAATSGAASARVFLDSNANGLMDPGEPPLEDVQLRIASGGQRAATNEEGLALLPKLAAHQPTDIALDERTLADPFWRPATAGVRVTPRPGRMAVLDFPVQQTGEIAGTLYWQDGTKRRELPGVEVELVSETGEIAKTRTAYDGFYDLPNLRAGRYTLRVASERLASLGRSAPAPREVRVFADGTVLDGVDFVVEDPTAVLVKLDRTAPQSAPDSLVLPTTPGTPFELDSAEGRIRVQLVRSVKFPLASWAAGLPLSEEEIEGLEKVGAVIAASPRSRLLIVSHAQTLGAEAGAVKRATKGADLLKRYLRAVQLVPAKKVSVVVRPPEPGGEPLGSIELLLLDRLEMPTNVL